MRITKKIAHQMLEVFDDIWEEIRNKEQSPYPYNEWERKRGLIKQRLRKLPEYVKKAASMIVVQQTTGRPKTGDLVQRTMLFLFARLMNKSNRDAEELLELFEPLFGITVSYKSIERLYSDEGVQAVVHNLFILLLKDENLSGDIAGDGTGYAMTITKHYRTRPDKRSKDYRYAFRLIDLEEGMYVGVGYSSVSEKDAFNKAMDMAKSLDVPINTARLDKYFSSRTTLNLFGEKVVVYLIPKKNISKIGLKWSKLIRKMIESPFLYLKEYLKRNLSEVGYSSDKRRFGGVIRQKREDRQDSALFSIALFHNIFFIRAGHK